MLVQLVGTHYWTMDIPRDKELNIIVADAMTWRPKPGERFDVVWHDIWNNICTDNLPEMSKLHRSYGRRCNWRGSWGKNVLSF